MYTNSTGAREKPGKTGDQGPLCFYLGNAFVCSSSRDEVDPLKHLLVSVSRYTISQAVPHLVELFLNPDELSNRAPITVLLAELVAAARDSMTKKLIDNELDVPLMPFKDEVLGVFTVGLRAPFCQPALAGLKAMVTTPTLLADEELGFIVHNVSGILHANSDDDARFAHFLITKRHLLMAYSTVATY
jgi:hypothetical protein